MASSMSSSGSFSSVSGSLSYRQYLDTNRSK
nr:MAG TPA: hypothetical protein [Caudoviricetes sp.]